MKTCSKCDEVKPLSDFYITRGKHISWCKCCSSKIAKALNQKFNEQRTAKKREHYHQNIETIKEQKRINYSANKEKILAKNRKWANNNTHLLVARNIARRKKLQQHTLPCLTPMDLLCMKSIYQVAAMRNRESDHKWEVDHIIPIAGDSVCGLHVPWNLRVVTMQENRSKSNKLHA
jgi:hypothetical protein